MLPHLRTKIRLLANPNVMFFTLIWLMLIVIVGTVAQKYIGLYQAQHQFFSSWFIWLGPIPLPGGLFALAIIFCCLSVKLVFASQWKLANAGIIVTHTGGLLLLFGGLLTSFGSSEGTMLIYEGATANFITDYHIREVAVYDTSNPDQKIFALPLEKLPAGTVISIPQTPLTLQSVQACRNCDVVNRPLPATPSTEVYQGRAQDFTLQPITLDKEDEQNKAGIEFKISGADAAANGTYFSVDYIDEAPMIAAQGKTYRIVLERRHTFLPFSLTLKKFDKQFHPGTDIARSYQSFVTLKDGVSEWPSLIQMNEPLRYKGYTFYQSSFIEDGDKKATILAVVKNAGRMFPYISGAVICLGLILHMMLRLPKLVSGIIAGRKIKKTALLALFLAGLSLHPAQATTLADFDYTAFKTIPVLDQGRVKPLDTVAQNYLKQFHGATSLPDMSAIDWFAELIFTPENSYNRKIFNISDPRVVDALGLERRKPHYYSYLEIAGGLTDNKKVWQGLFDIPEEQLTASQKELLTTYEEAQTYGQLSRSLSLYFPEFVIPAGTLATAFGVPPDSALTYVDMLDHEDTLNTLGQMLSTPPQKKRGDGRPLARLSAEDANAVMVLGKQYDAIGDDRQSDVFKIIPPQWDSQKAGKLWYSPWGISAQGQGSPEVVKFLALWRDLVADYRSNKTYDFLSTTETIERDSLRMAGDSVSETKILLEVAYNTYQPFKISMSLYALAFVLVLVSLMFRGDNKLYYVSAAALLGGFVFHGIGLLSRMIIMGRPPVTNLYASIIFVGFMVALVAMAYEWRMRNRIGVIVAAIAGLVLQYLGLSYDVEGDTMGMLVAVLDTNFWLSTHVVCMTTGYACCILGSLMAHVYLVLRMVKPQDAARLGELSRNILGVSYLALMFACVGTILGGIWADQSWGRFWGWDPKENGALLICLWLLFITHGRMAKRFEDLGFIIGMAMTSITVALAWFGVNLLAIGLHSYGFTQGAATGLTAFIVGEVLFAILSYGVIKKWHKKTSS